MSPIFSLLHHHNSNLYLSPTKIEMRHLINFFSDQSLTQRRLMRNNSLSRIGFRGAKDSENLLFPPVR